IHQGASSTSRLQAVQSQHTNGSSQTFRPHKYIMPFKHYKS
ncbi:hypothetical protein CDAR_225321, partial [Caerostris darwini]